VRGGFLVQEGMVIGCLVPPVLCFFIRLECCSNYGLKRCVDVKAMLILKKLALYVTAEATLIYSSDISQNNNANQLRECPGISIILK
jgi:hypothetical protein